MAPAAREDSVVTDDLVVTVNGGEVRGRPVGSAVTWRGIPFAAPAVGALRWRGPQPVVPWEGVRDATEFGPSPMQHPGDELPLDQMSEDCLTVNVTRRAETSAELKPVLVYLYGGSNAGGHSSYSLLEGLPLVEAEDIVFVTGNYRVGPFGFTNFASFATPEHPIDTNLGLRDQLGILEWVRDNIAAFGGDPDRVTLAGQSAGALGVTTLLTVPRAAGLFHAAIAQSSPVASVFLPARGVHHAQRVVDALGATSANAAEVLHTRAALDIVEAAREAMQHEQHLTPGMLSFSSVVDGDLLPEHPLDVLREGRGHPVPMLIGTVHNEGTLFTGVNAPRTPVSQVLAMLEVTDTYPRERITDAYPGYPALPATTAIIGDFLFWAPTIQAAEGHSRVARVWMYRYDHGTPLLRRLHLTPTHGMDLPAVFGPNSDLSRAARHLSAPNTLDLVTRVTRRTWLDLVLHQRERWPRYEAPARPTLIVDRVTRVHEDPHPERREVWEGFPYYHAEAVDRRARTTAAPLEQVARWAERVDAFWSAAGDSETDALVAQMLDLVRERRDGDPEALYEWASVHDYVGRHAEAATLYRCALDAGLDGAARDEAIVQLASSLRELGRPGEAIDLLREVPAGRERGPAAHAFQALALRDLGRHDEALRVALDALVPLMPVYGRAIADHAAALGRPADPEPDASWVAAEVAGPTA